MLLTSQKTISLWNPRPSISLHVARRHPTQHYVHSRMILKSTLGVGGPCIARISLREPLGLHCGVQDQS
jgi:hypothetical protein